MSYYEPPDIEEPDETRQCRGCQGRYEEGMLYEDGYHSEECRVKDVAELVPAKLRDSYESLLRQVSKMTEQWMREVADRDATIETLRAEIAAQQLEYDAAVRESDRRLADQTALQDQLKTLREEMYDLHQDNEAVRAEIAAKDAALEQVLQIAESHHLDSLVKIRQVLAAIDGAKGATK